MRSLLKANILFRWGPEHEKEFNEQKKLLSSKPLIQSYNLLLPIKISCDTGKKKKMIGCYTWAATWRPVTTCCKCTQSDNRDTKQVCPDGKRNPGDTVCLWPFPSVHIWKTSVIENGPQTTSSHIFKKRWMIAQHGYKGFDSRCKNTICTSATFQERLCMQLIHYPVQQWQMI